MAALLYSSKYPKSIAIGAKCGSARSQPLVLHVRLSQGETERLYRFNTRPPSDASRGKLGYTDRRGTILGVEAEPWVLDSETRTEQIGHVVG